MASDLRLFDRTLKIVYNTGITSLRLKMDSFSQAGVLFWENICQKEYTEEKKINQFGLLEKQSVVVNALLIKNLLISVKILDAVVD